MNTKYGQLPDEMLVGYVDRMMSQVFKMLPMKQYGVETLPKHMEATLREFVGIKDVVYKLRDNSEFLAIIGTLESALSQDDFKTFRSDILKTTNLIEKLKNSLGDVDE